MSLRKPARTRRNPSVEIPRYPPATAPQPTIQQLQQIHQQENLVSDSYDSDNQAYPSDYPIRPPPAERTNDELNLSVLRRHNPDITTILSIAPFAVIYDFTPLPEPTWSKSGVEGSLFICHLTPGPHGEDRYIATVLNRRGPDNFTAELREGDNAGVEVSGDFVIVSYRHGREQRINGIFIFSDGPGTSTEKTRGLNADLMKSLATQAGLSRKTAEAAAARHTNGHMKEAEATVTEAPTGSSMTRQMTLQDMFSQQRQASGYDGGNDSRLQPQGAAPQQDVLGDLFRRAGFA